MIRVVFLIRSLNIGGAERQLVTLVKRLDKNQFDVMVVCYYSGGPLIRDLYEAGIRVIFLLKKGRWDIFGFLWRLVKLLRNEKPDVLYSFLVISNLITVLLKPLFPRVKMVWGVRASNVDLSRYDWLSRITFWLSCYFACFADLTIVNSFAGRDYHCDQGYHEKKMVVIHNGIDTEQFKPDSGARARVRAEWGIADHVKLISLVGRLDPMKDHPTFLRAAALLAQERADVRFVCVGDGPEPYRSQLHALDRKLGLEEHLIWAGSRSDIPAIYNALDIASSSSFGEGFPNAVAEAMACGVPCVVTDVGDSARIVGKLGEVVPPGDPQAMAQALKRMVERLDDEPGIKNHVRARIVDNFNIDVLVSRTENALMCLL